MHVARTRQAMEFDAVPVIMMAHQLAHHHGDTATLRLNNFMRDVCGDSPRCHVLIVEHDGQMAGFAAGHFTYQFQNGMSGFEIQNLFIRSEFRGRGLGRKLVRDIAEFAVERDCKRISLGATSSNRDAILFYKRIGFEKGRTGGDVERFHLEGRKLKEFTEKRR